MVFRPLSIVNSFFPLPHSYFLISVFCYCLHHSSRQSPSLFIVVSMFPLALFFSPPAMCPFICLCFSLSFCLSFVSSLVLFIPLSCSVFFVLFLFFSFLFLLCLCHNVCLAPTHLSLRLRTSCCPKRSQSLSR